MLRTKVAIVAAMAVILCVMSPGLAQVVLGKPYKGNITGKKQVLSLKIKKEMYILHNVFTRKVPVNLKAGESIKISVSVLGDERNVGLALVNPDGVYITADVTTERLPGSARTGLGGGKTAQLEYAEVGKTGKYTILVISDQTGDFTLVAKGSSVKDSDN